MFKKKKKEKPPFKMGTIIGQKVVAIRGFPTALDKEMNFTWITPQYILFEDEKTVIELEDQDSYTFHDCSDFAKEIHIHTDEAMWKNIMEDTEKYPPATDDITEY